MKAIVAGSVFLPKHLVDTEDLVKHLTVEQWLMGEKEAASVSAYYDAGKYIAVPRDFGLKLISKRKIKLQDCRVAGQHFRFPRVVKHTGDYEFQHDFVQKILDCARTQSDFIVQAATGKGKCLARGTPVMLFTGKVVPVERVKRGDLLMGPDSLPRLVDTLSRGREEMFKVTPTKGDSYTVNRSHILSLRITGLGRGKKVTAGDGVKYSEGEIVDISVDDYLSSSSTFRHVAKGWRVGTTFTRSNHLPIPPYILGSWLGDGSSYHAKLFCDDVEVVAEWRKYAQDTGTHLVRGSEASVGTYSISSGPNGKWNPLMQGLRSLGVLCNKHIPEEYLTATRKERLEVLAGLVDTDGCISYGCFDLVFINEQIADGVTFLARSLGMAAYSYPCKKECVNNGVWGDYFRVRISGHIDEVPCRVPRKKATVRQQKKNVLNVGITIESVGEGEYYGFEIDGDRRFLLGDFTVTHNTVCSLSVAQKLGKTTLVVVDQDNLMQQWKRECKAVLGLKDEQIGTVQGPICDYQGKGVTVAMMQSLVGREYPYQFYDYFGTVIFDEVHTAGAPTFSEALMLFPAKTRFGVSATVERGDSLQKIIHWNLGDISVELTDTHDDSYLYYIESDTVYSWYANISPKVGRMISEVSNDAERNNKIVSAIQWLYDTGRDVLVISDRIEQLENLMAMSYYKGVPEEDMGLYCGFSSRWVFAKDPKPKRRPFGYQKGTEYTPVKLTLVRKRTGKATLANILLKSRVIFATFGMFAKGVDVKRLSGGIDCTPRSKAQQVHGRILRKQEGKPIPVWVTIRDISSYRLEYQFLKRIDEYEASSAEIYRWNLNNNAVRLADVKDLKRNLRESIKELKALNIITSEGGNYILTTLPMPK